MSYSVRILSTKSLDSSPSVLLVSSDGTKTLVNCGEGCQRTFLEFGQKVSSMNRICLTHLSHDSIGGIPGMILTAADVLQDAVSSAKAALVHNNKKPQKPEESALPGLHLLGPVGTQKFVSSLRHFMRRDSFQVKVHEGAYSQPKNGGPKKRKKGSKNEGAYDVQSIVCHTNDFHRSEDSTKRQRLETNDQALSYIFTTPPIQGKFLVERAIALGIPKGPLFGQLKNGKSVTFTNEAGTTRTISSSEVVEPGSPGISIAVLYYPSNECLDQLKSSEKLKEYQENEKGHPVLEVIVHMATRDLFLGKEAKEWRESFGSEVKHIFLATDLRSSTETSSPFHSGMMGAIARSKVCSSVYNVPNIPIQLRETTPAAQPEGETVPGYMEAQPLLEYIIVPRSKRGFGSRNASVLHWRSIQKQVLQILEQSGAKGEAENALSHHSSVLTSNANNDKNRGELIFTGTGSAIPCKYRNVSGIYLKMENGNAMLLDVGEGTVGQLMRALSSSFSEVLCAIKAVWISHPHADHHLGLLRLLSDRNQVTDDPLLLIAPTSMLSFLLEYQEVDATVQGSYTFVDCKEVSTKVQRHLWLPEKHESHAKKMEQLHKDLGITRCTSVPVAHCRDAFAVILENTCFGRLVYSGDCRPSRPLAYAALGADLLIHEATFANGMEAEATLKRHSTIGEALQVAEDMKAKAVILTHFSQRYPKVPPVASKHNAPIVFAFDFVRVTPDNLLVAADLTQSMRLLYSEETAEKDEIMKDADVEAMNVPGLFAQKDVL
ncbi:unnamed protein product [Cylindrotheca closterium]|uniref:ribonuclease Z n=1 Tax=Cylindrotheca closterium TaxID=2856 RepID=A0AAD2FFD5_9STRA|nr:unnamed protein product [Cylindrotheca closterium]